MECIICYREVSGADGAPDKDWIACQACGQVVCLQCARHPASELCDLCIEQYNDADGRLAYNLSSEGRPPELDDACWL
jgi:hypothetical protein